MSGIFITFEGGEGSGKSTAIAAVGESLKARGVQYIITREPGAGPVGQEIRNMLLHQGELPHATELFLFLADRSNHVSTIIKPALAEGKVVLCDRYIDSTWVYQSFVRGLDSSFVEAANRFATGDLLPDVTFFLDVSPEIGLSRLTNPDRLDAQPLGFHQRVHDGFRHLSTLSDRWRTVDASMEPGEVHESILEILEGYGL